MRRVFFSFHFQRDSFKVGQIRNSWLGNSAFEGQPYLDKADWETIERRGPTAVKNWIDGQMKGTSVTIVLIGRETLQRPWVRYEIAETKRRGAGLFGINMAGMTNIDRTTDYGTPTFAGTEFQVKAFGGHKHPVYNWVSDQGRENLGRWIEQAARSAGR